MVRPRYSRRYSRVPGIPLTENWSRPPTADDDAEEIAGPFALVIPTILVVNKVGLAASREAELAAFLDLIDTRFPAIETSVETGEGLASIGRWLFDKLEIVRVYTKVPGRPPDRDRPFTVRAGATVHNVAMEAHRALADGLKFARLRGSSGQFAGQQVSRDHPVRDGDVLELHA